MNNVSSENGKVLAKTLSGSNLDAVKTKLRGLPYFKMTLPLFLSFPFSPFPLPIPLSLCHK